MSKPKRNRTISKVESTFATFGTCLNSYEFFIGDACVLKIIFPIDKCPGPGVYKFKASLEEVKE